MMLMGDETQSSRVTVTLPTSLVRGHPKSRDATHGVVPETDGTVAAPPAMVTADDYDVAVPDEGHDADVVRHHGNRADPRGGRLAVGRVLARQIAAARVASLLEDYIEVVSAPVVGPPVGFVPL